MKLKIISLSFFALVFAASDNIINSSVDVKLLVADTNDYHEYHFLWFTPHLCEDSQMSEKTGING